MKKIAIVTGASSGIERYIAEFSLVAQEMQ